MVGNIKNPHVKEGDIVFVGRRPFNKIGKEQYYKLRVISERNGCTIYKDTIKTLDLLGISYSLYDKEEIRRRDERIGSAYYLYFIEATKDEYIRFQENPYVNGILAKTNGSNKKLSFLLKKEEELA